MITSDTTSSEPQNIHRTLGSLSFLAEFPSWLMQ